jgi:hypothetical protein
MRKIEVEMLSEASNQVVLKLPGRAFPGSVVQGDSLAVLLSLARTVRDRARLTGDPELAEQAAQLHELLRGRLLHYQSTLLASGWRLPYGAPVEEDA